MVAGRTLGVSVEVLHLPSPPRRHQRKCVIMTLGADGTRRSGQILLADPALRAQPLNLRFVIIKQGRHLREELVGVS